MHSGQKNNHHMISEMEKSRKRQKGGGWEYMKVQ